MPVPEIEFVGESSDLFPRRWAVVSWVQGDLPFGLDSRQQADLAETLGRFMEELHAVDVSGIPGGAEHWGYRSGEPVTETIDAWADDAAKRLSSRSSSTVGRAKLLADAHNLVLDTETTTRAST